MSLPVVKGQTPVAWITGTLPDTRYLDELLLDERGRLRCVPSAELARLPRSHLMVWGHHHAVFQFPTTELVDWLREEIGKERAIEIAAGNGAIGRALGVVMTDSYLHDDPLVRANVEALGQVPVRPPADVVRLEAVDAVRRFRPGVVFGAWVTQYTPLSETGNGNARGVREDRILRRVNKYIVFGNAATHGTKAICALPHEERAFPWLFTRSVHPHLDRVWTWKRP